jgi:hypothetical protein
LKNEVLVSLNYYTKTKMEGVVALRWLMRYALYGWFVDPIAEWLKTPNKIVNSEQNDVPEKVDQTTNELT